jgi:alkanesulfonate monooxygenase SsuD/methylene tetrahydromethanopterin reductase-like flavin-dependent oxidoreductase (luciferase family)
VQWPQSVPDALDQTSTHRPLPIQGNWRPHSKKEYRCRADHPHESPDDPGGSFGVDTYREELTEARDQGFRRMWTTQFMWEPDLLTIMAATLGQVSGIEVGTAVLPLQVQHPTLLAQRALVVNQIAGGRLKLGLGVNHPGITDEMWGIPFEKPVRLMRECLDGLLPLLAGKPADAVGEMVTTRVNCRFPGRRRPKSISPPSARRCWHWPDGVPQAR